MHIASALGVPTVAIFGATDDTTTGPTDRKRAWFGIRWIAALVYCANVRSIIGA